MRKKILLIHTGGTIGIGINVGTMDLVRIETILEQIMSRHNTDDRVDDLLKNLRQCRRDHGSLTLEQTTKHTQQRHDEDGGSQHFDGRSCLRHIYHDLGEKFSA